MDLAFQIPDLQEAENSVLAAINAGYRLIDTAALFMNESAVGSAIGKSEVPREDLFVTSKVWVNDTGYENTKAAFGKTLDLMKLDYLDLFLIHQPFGDVYGSWRALEDLYKEGKIRAIGVSNFQPDRLSQYDHPRQLLKLAGLNLRKNESGTHKGQTTITKRGRKRLRALLFRVAMPLAANNPAFKALHEYYRHRSENPLTGKQSLIALCGKLIRILFIIGHRECEFSEERMIQDMPHLRPQKQAA